MTDEILLMRRRRQEGCVWKSGPEVSFARLRRKLGLRRMEPDR